MPNKGTEFVKASELLAQLNGKKIPARHMGLEIGMSERRTGDFLKGKTKYMNIDSADRLCIAYDLVLPERIYTIGEVFVNFVAPNHCSRGHTNWHVAPNGKRSCKDCQTLREMKYQARILARVQATHDHYVKKVANIKVGAKKL